MGKYERDKLSLDNQVVKSNKMVNGKYKMSALEHKLVLTLCSKITSEDNMFQEFTMTANEFANFLGIENKDYEFNRTLKRKCKVLNTKDIEMNLRNERRARLVIFPLVWIYKIYTWNGNSKNEIQPSIRAIPTKFERNIHQIPFRLCYKL